MKRLTIITDSLGMARDCTPREQTWIDLFLCHLMQDSNNIKQIAGGGVITYFFAKRGLHTQDMLNDKIDLLLYQKSDFVIIQSGVVDASRRIMKRGLEWRIESLPILGKLYKNFTSTFRLKLTRLYHYHYVSPANFYRNVISICDDIYKANPNAKILWIAIAPPGEFLISKVYAIQQDIKLYNNILAQCATQKHFEILNPYTGYNTGQITIRDGHHLSAFGHKLVYQALKEKLESYLSHKSTNSQ
ncbi:SGNH/GDSL hydrolase family protein [Helicobacter cinaedi]|uniref:SGNH/GDSL hydrolase family protein n=1 Tax=Helicobacter cinaedi TaxID=213 RepID=UPI0018A4F60B|nr:SGNH/GDSL hydrolase family protein [Helicobacter cinaedi]QOQ91548.1 SGNH/GDSL hydrolase family protein [Helicobacter cinaedi]